MKKIMILGASILQLPAIEKATAMGLDVIAVDRNPAAVGFAVQGVTSEIISTVDTPAILKAAAAHRISGIMTLASDMPMQSVAAVCHKLRLAGISQETALMATNKAFMRDALRKKGVPIPQYFRVRTKEAFLEAVEAIRDGGRGCIVKPADNSGSRGVTLVTNGDESGAAYEYCKKYSRSGEIMVEEFMEGPEVSVEAFAVSGNVHVVQITDKVTSGEPYFVEMGHSQPCLFRAEMKEKIAEISIAANKAIGLVNGPSHTEIKITRDGPKVVELGARLGGDYITTHLVPLSTGVDMVGSNIRFALGEAMNLEPTHDLGSAIRFFDFGIGTVQKIEGVEKARKLPGVVQVEILHSVGERIKRIKSSGDRSGFVIAQGADAREAVRRCEEAFQEINILLKGEPSYESFSL